MGLALLSGFGDSNTKTVAEAPANQTASCEPAPQGIGTGQTEADTLVVKSPQQLRKEEKERLDVRGYRACTGWIGKQGASSFALSILTIEGEWYQYSPYRR